MVKPNGSDATNAWPLDTVTPIALPRPGTYPTNTGSNDAAGVAVTTGVAVRVAVAVAT